MKGVVLFLLFTIFCSMFTVSCFAQKQGQALIDSILTQLPTAKEDTNKVKLLGKVSFTYYSINPEEGLKYGNEELALAEKIKWQKGIAGANCNIGSNYWAKSDFPKAMQFYLLALKQYEAQDDKLGMVMTLGNTASVYDEQHNFSKALECDEKVLKMYKELKNKQGIALITGNMGLVFYEKADYPKALEYEFQSMKLYEELGNKNGVANNLDNIAAVYNSQSDYKKSLEYNFKALKIFEELGDKRGIEIIYGSVGEVYLKIAKDNNKEQLNKLFGGNKTVALKKAQVYIDSAIAICKATGYLADLQYSYNNLSETQALLGDNAKALESYKNYTTIKDSVFNQENKLKTAQLQMQYDFDKKVAATKAEQEKRDAIAQKEVQKQKLVRNGFIGGFVVMLLFAGVFFYQRNKIQKGKKQSDELLLNILPSEVAEELKQTGSAKAKQFDNVSVIFTDFVGFTLVSEKLTPQQLVEEIHLCFTAFDTIIERNGLEKIKTIGDAYLAVCGMPMEDKAHAQKAVRASLEIMEFINKREIEGGRFKIRIGINSGPVVAGIVGVKKFAYDIWGDTVNTASRMEENSRNGKINISGSTYELVKNDFECTYRGKIEAKNKGEVDMYFVVTDNES